MSIGDAILMSGALARLHEPANFQTQALCFQSFTSASSPRLAPDYGEYPEQTSALLNGLSPFSRANRA